MKQLVCILAIISVGTSAMALSLQEKKQKQEWVDSLKEKDDYYKNNCGYVASATFDEAMIAPFMKENASLAGYCDDIRSAVAGMCSDATAKAEITKKVKKFHCKLGTGDKVGMKINGGTVEATFSTKAANVSDQVTKFMNESL